MKLQFDLMTGFSTIPLRMVTMAGISVSILSVAFAVFLLGMRLWKGPEWAQYGTFTLFSVLFFLVGGLFFGMGMLGEYIGRIYVEVRSRPRSVVHETINL